MRRLSMVRVSLLARITFPKYQFVYLASQFNELVGVLVVRRLLAQLLPAIVTFVLNPHLRASSSGPGMMYHRYAPRLHAANIAVRIMLATISITYRTFPFSTG